MIIYTPFSPYIRGFIRKTTTVAVALATLFCFSCATMVTIDSEPSGANLYINNQKMGKTPYRGVISDFVGDTQMITLRKEGYQEYKGYLAKEGKVGTILLGVLFLIPYLWCYGPIPNQVFPLTKESTLSGTGILNSQTQYLIQVDGTTLTQGMNPLEPGIHTISCYSENSLVAEYQTELQEGLAYELKT